MKIRRASTEEVQVALGLLKETAEWLKEIGSDQWSDILEGHDKHGLSAAVIRGDVYFFYNDAADLIGMAAAWREASPWDQVLWKNFEVLDNCRYIHRIVIRPKYRKAGYGSQLLKELKTFFYGEASELRLDCIGNNYKLIDFYQQNGFINIGQEKDLEGTRFELFSCLLEK